MLRVTVLANRQLVGEAIALAIGQEPGVRIVVGSTQPTKAGAHPRVPDLVVVLGSRADGSTAAATAASRRRWPRSVIVATADTDRVEDGVELLQRGADTWLARGEGVEQLRAIIARVAAGDRHLLPAEVLAQLTDIIRKAPRRAGRLVGRLTSREAQVLACLVDGLTRAQIAETLEISAATVRTHVQNVLHKLEVHSAQQAIGVALREGMRTLPTS